MKINKKQQEKLGFSKNWFIQKTRNSRILKKNFAFLFNFLFNFYQEPYNDVFKFE